MHRRWLSRALIALVAPAVIIPAATSATAAGSGPQVPTIEAVAKIYPHLEGGTASVSTSKVHGPGKDCKAGKVIKGASARYASYSPDYSSGDPDAYAVTGKRPSVSVSAMKFPSTKSAIDYLHGSEKSTKDCPTPGTGGNGGDGPTCDTSTKKIAFTLGDERWGYQIKSTCDFGGQTTTMVFNTLFVRKANYIVYTSAMSMDGTAPSTSKSVSLTKLGLKTAS
jgi:hypothetical protein